LATRNGAWPNFLHYLSLKYFPQHGSVLINSNPIFIKQKIKRTYNRSNGNWLIMIKKPILAIICENEKKQKK
jgi:hypothetical protein